jgi:hypothetical protein
MSLTRAARLIAVLAAAGGLAASPAIAGAHHANHKHHKHHTHHTHRSPQHNGGDHDADNNGGPSDGDGNV